MIRRLLGLAVVLLLLGAASNDPVKITADSFTVDDAQHVATFTGNVVVSRTDLTVWAGKVVVVYGDAGPSSIKSLTATGGVRVKATAQEARGDKVTFDPATQIMRLSGHVMLTSGKSTIGSSDLVIDLKASTTTFSSGKGGRVTGVFSSP